MSVHKKVLKWPVLFGLFMALLCPMAWLDIRAQDGIFRDIHKVWNW